MGETRERAPRWPVRGEKLERMTLLSLTCGALAAMLYFAPLPMMRSIVASGTVGRRSVLPLTSAMLSAAVWGWYGLLTHNYMPMAFVNGAGMLIEAAYIGVFIRHARESKGRAVFTLVAAIGLLSFAVVLYVMRAPSTGYGDAVVERIVTTPVNVDDSTSLPSSFTSPPRSGSAFRAPETANNGSGGHRPGNMASRLGNIGVVMSCFMFVSPFATVREVLKSRSAKSLPFGMIVMGWLCAGCWSLYGWRDLGDAYVYGPNMFGFLLSSLQLGLHQRYTNPLCLKYFEAASRRQKLKEMSETLPNPFESSKPRVVIPRDSQDKDQPGNRLFKVKSLLGGHSSGGEDGDGTSVSQSFLRV